MTDIKKIQEDLKGLRLSGRKPDQLSNYAHEVEASYRDLGEWIHDEESGHEREGEGDMDWREDDDNMILAPGEKARLFAEFVKWAKQFPWRKDVVLSIEASEKNWVVFTITPFT